MNQDDLLSPATRARFAGDAREILGID